MVHIIGAGVTGLAAATKLAEAHVPVRLYEATANAGGRAKSTRDIALGTVDHGLHFISGAMPELSAYLTRIGAQESLVRIAHPLRFQPAPIADYLNATSLLANPHGYAQDAIAADNILRYGWLARASRVLLHTPLEQLSAVAAKTFVRRHVRQIHRAMQAHVPARSLSESFISPALNHLEYLGGSVYFNHSLSAIEREGGRVTGLTFPKQKVAIGESDIVIVATQAHQAAQLLPEIAVNSDALPALTVHYKLEHREADGIHAPLDAPVDLVRYQPGRISVSVRVADHLWNSDPAYLAGHFWKWLVTQHAYLPEEMPANAVCREKYAGYALTPEPSQILPALDERLLVAGDWCVPHLPATLETAAMSGHLAADRAIALLGKHPLRTQ